MCNFSENARGIIEPALGICVSKGHDFVGHHHNLLNSPRADEVVSQYFQKVQPPCTENVVSEDEVLLREGPDAYGLISLPCASVSTDQFYVRWWD